MLPYRDGMLSVGLHPSAKQRRTHTHTPHAAVALPQQVRVALDGRVVSVQDLPYPSPPSGLAAADGEVWRQVSECETTGRKGKAVNDGRWLVAAGAGCTRAPHGDTG